MVSSANLKELILSSIDQLRHRKARPDLDRICHMLRRRHGVKADEVKEALDRLVGENVVIKVVYKGSISYRNAAKWARGSRGTLAGSTNLSTPRLKCSTNVPNPPGVATDNTAIEQIQPVQKCVPVETDPPRVFETPPESMKEEILEPIVEQAADTREECCVTPVNLPPAPVFTQRCYARSLVFTEQQPQPVEKSVLSEDDDDEETVVEAPKPKQTSETVARRGRPPSKRKRIRKTHGPDFVESTNILSPDKQKEEAVCDYCLLTASSNCNGEPEDLLVCKDCNATAHPSCMEYTPELAAKSRMFPWQCMDCKTCSICEDSGDGSSMLFCDSCDKGYHMDCHVPKITEKPKGKWICSQCVQETFTRAHAEVTAASLREIFQNDKQRMELDTTCLPTPCDSPVPDDEVTSEYNGTLTALDGVFNQYPSIIPDAKDWTIDDVEQFFMHVGFLDQAPAFRDQEIDGKSLLLMKRTDVLTGLSLKLGPALKIYNHIKRLQTGLLEGR